MGHRFRWKNLNCEAKNGFFEENKFCRAAKFWELNLIKYSLSAAMCPIYKIAKRAKSLHPTVQMTQSCLVCLSRLTCLPILQAKVQRSQYFHRGSWGSKGKKNKNYNTVDYGLTILIKEDFYTPVFSFFISLTHLKTLFNY